MRRNAVWRDGRPDDGCFLRQPTVRGAGRRQAAGGAESIVRGMDEPTHANENRFWDEVTDWILDSREYDAADLTDAGIESMLDHDDDFDAF